MKNKSRLLEQLKSVPNSPGVYIYRDIDAKVIYVGKAKSLKNRMRSYFHNRGTDPKTRALVERIADFDFYVTGNEIEALVLECNLIKKYRPVFNVSYRDDKSYPYLAITWQDEFPRIMVTRERHRKGTKYYGPYTSVQPVRETFDTLRRIFPFRTCKRAKPGKSTGSPCLNYHIKRCLGPCIGAVAKDEYREMMEQVELFLEGRPNPVVKQLEAEMEEAAAGLEFERAARVRDRLEAARHVLQKQKIVSEAGEDYDAIGYSLEDSLAGVNLLVIRDGKLIGSDNFVLARGGLDEDVVSAFIKQHYVSSVAVPPQIIVPGAVEDRELIEEWLGIRRGSKVTIKTAQRGAKRDLLEMASSNARHALAMSAIKYSWEQESATLALTSLASALGLAGPPGRIECFDISTTHGSNSVGSMTVFINGRASKGDYRKFKIKHVEGLNDFAMIHEVISRRLGHLGDDFDPSFAAVPDLIIVDGGKGQLSAAISALQEKGYPDIPIIGLAKREEAVFMPGQPDSLILDRSSEALKLLQRMRDEAHRYAIAYHRKLRGKAMVESTLDKIPGVGENRKRLLLTHFGAPGVIADAALEELKSIPGLPDIIAERVHRHFHSNGGKL
ncbi:MAG: excinuclease ABC subunit UvrC [Actinomycetota bacterium]|nr:excinuclease ABC subunit UvrC [Actinomycetota bacterium]